MNSQEIDRLFKYEWKDFYPDKFYHCVLKLKVGYFNSGDKFESIEFNHKEGKIIFSPYKDSAEPAKDYIFNLHYSIGACLSDT